MAGPYYFSSTALNSLRAAPMAIRASLGGRMRFELTSPRATTACSAIKLPTTSIFIKCNHRLLYFKLNHYQSDLGAQRHIFPISIHTHIFKVSSARHSQLYKRAPQYPHLRLRVFSYFLSAKVGRTLIARLDTRVRRGDSNP